jgi:hypothetical protein
VRSATWNAADPPIGVAVKVISKKILKGHDEIVQGEMDVLKVSDDVGGRSGGAGECAAPKARRARRCAADSQAF